MSQFWFRWGYFGVPLFFTLSGYLVGGLLISEFVRYGKIDVGRFLIRRSLKIYPPYFLFLVYIVMAPTLKGTVPLRDMLSDYWENFVFLQNYIGPDLAGHTWSLAVEEHFYLLLPFLLLACVRFGCMAWIVPLCLLSPLGGTAVRIISASIGDPYIHNFPNTMAATHLCVDGLLVGVGIRALNEFRPDAFNRLKVWRWVLLFTGTAILATSALSMPKFLGVDLVDRILPISTVAATAFLVAMLHMRPAGWIADATAWVGKYSYGIYLWHVTILGFAKRIIVSRIPGGSHSAHWVAAAMILIVSSVLFGALMSRLVEWPVLALRERVFPSRCASLPSRM